ncbi:MAG: hypothetical protein U0939_02980 [Pirellulales bacterium]
MITAKQATTLGVCGWLFVAFGCNATNVGQLERCQADKKQLLARVVEEQKRSESLTTDLRTANQKLADAEKQLARVYDGGRNRYAATPVPSLAPPTRPFVSGPQPIQEHNGPGMMASGGGANRMLSSGSTSGFTRRDGASSNGSFTGSPIGSGASGGAGISAPASPILDSSGFDDLAPRNGRSESGWMPKSTSRP